MRKYLLLTFACFCTGWVSPACKTDRSPFSSDPVITITVQPAAPAALTEGSVSGTLAVTATVTGGAKPAYRWYTYDPEAEVVSEAAGNAADAIYTLPADLRAGTHYFLCEVSAPKAASVRTDPVTVTVKPASVPVIAITAQPAAPPVFTEGGIPENTKLTVTASVTGGAKLKYQWYGGTSDGNAAGSAIGGATGASYILPTGLAPGTYFYFCEIGAEGVASVRTEPVAVVVIEKKTEEKDDIIDGYGNLHIFPGSGKSIRVVAAKAGGAVLDTLVAEPTDKLKFRYHSMGEGVNVSFDFNLHSGIEHPYTLGQPAKTLVVSDFHGQLGAAVAVLKGNGVVDDELNWTFGTNQLLVLGDMLDRGRDDNGIAWLVYKLEKEAEEAGGRLDFISGNHEDLVMKNDLRYIHADHTAFVKKAGVAYNVLYGPGTELGRWLRGRYLVLTEGEGGNIFVHAGINPALVDGKYTVREMNELGLLYTGMPNAERNKLNPRNEKLFDGSSSTLYGVIWYRGMVKDDGTAISSANLDKVLNYYGAGRMFVGHTEVPEVAWRYDGRVVAINVAHATNYPKDGTAGVLMEGGNIYSVTYSGKKVLSGNK